MASEKMREKVKSVKFVATDASAEFDYNVQLDINEINCCVCLEDVFAYETLDCNHTVCSWCLSNYVIACKARKLTPSCPICRGCMSLEAQARLEAYYFTVTDFSKQRRSSRDSRPPLRFTTDGHNYSLY